MFALTIPCDCIGKMLAPKFPSFDYVRFVDYRRSEIDSIQTATMTLLYTNAAELLLWVFLI